MESKDGNPPAPGGFEIGTMSVEEREETAHDVHAISRHGQELHFWILLDRGDGRREVTFEDTERKGCTGGRGRRELGWNEAKM